MSIEKIYELVESCIDDLGISPVEARGEKAGQWSLIKGKAKVWVDVWTIAREGRPYFQVMSPIIKLPPEDVRLALFQELLEINDQLYGVAFTMHGGWIWLKVIRECDGLDKSEAAAMITRIGSYSDRYGRELTDKYYNNPPDTGPVGPGPSSD